MNQEQNENESTENRAPKTYEELFEKHPNVVILKDDFDAGRFVEMLVEQLAAHKITRCLIARIGKFVNFVA